MPTTKLFEIEEYLLDDNQIEVYINEQSIKTVTVKVHHKYEINRDKFELYLKTEGKLEYCFDWVEQGEHHQETGTMDLIEYWEKSKPYYIKQDLYDYILFKFLKI